MTLTICPTCNNLICSCPAIPSASHGDISSSPAEDISPLSTPLTQERLNKLNQNYLDNNQLSIKVIKPGKKDPTICEMCGAVNNDNWFKHCAMYMCPSCRDKEIALQAKSRAHENERVAQSHKEILEQSNQSITDEIKKVDQIAKEIPIDHEIQFKTDYFNADTTSIIERKSLIDADESITRKHEELAKQLKEEFLHLRKVLFSQKEHEVRVTSKIRGLQQYLNDLANKLTTAERERLKIADIKYQPMAPKVIKPKKLKKPKTPKFDMKELRRLAAETGIEMTTLRTICVSQNLSPVDAAKMLKGMQSS